MLIEDGQIQIKFVMHSSKLQCGGAEVRKSLLQCTTNPGTKSLSHFCGGFQTTVPKAS